MSPQRAKTVRTQKPAQFTPAHILILYPLVFSAVTQFFVRASAVHNQHSRSPVRFQVWRRFAFAQLQQFNGDVFAVITQCFSTLNAGFLRHNGQPLPFFEVSYRPCRQQKFMRLTITFSPQSGHLSSSSELNHPLQALQT